jgi:hypothetical protein
MKYLIACVGLVLVAAGLCGCSDELVGPFQAAGGGSGPDAAYSILLLIVPGEDHVKNAATLKNDVTAASGWGDVFVVHKAGWSELYHGHYASMEQAKSDLKKTKAWRNAAGAQPFAQAMIMALPGKETGPVEWNLLHASGMFTVTMAEFYDVPEASYVGRKDFAVRCCREFRSMGLEAYYYHGAVAHVAASDVLLSPPYSRAGGVDGAGLGVGVSVAVRAEMAQFRGGRAGGVPTHGAGTDGIAVSIVPFREPRGRAGAVNGVSGGVCISVAVCSEVPQLRRGCAGGVPSHRARAAAPQDLLGIPHGRADAVDRVGVGPRESVAVRSEGVQFRGG